MRSGTAAIVVLLLMLAVFGFLQTSARAGVPDGVIFFSERAGGLRSLRDVLAATEVELRLPDLAECLPLLRLATEETGDATGYEHRFEFAPEDRISARIYRVRVVTRYDPEQERFRIVHTEQGYGSVERQLPPLGWDRARLSVFSAALLEPAVFDHVSALLDTPSRRLRSVSIEAAGPGSAEAEAPVEGDLTPGDATETPTTTTTTTTTTTYVVRFEAAAAAGDAVTLSFTAIYGATDGVTLVFPQNTE
jgi:hypothetical protein